MWHLLFYRRQRQVLVNYAIDSHQCLIPFFWLVTQLWDTAIYAFTALITRDIHRETKRHSSVFLAFRHRDNRNNLFHWEHSWSEKMPGADWAHLENISAMVLVGTCSWKPHLLLWEIFMKHPTTGNTEKFWEQSNTELFLEVTRNQLRNRLSEPGLTILTESEE